MTLDQIKEELKKDPTKRIIRKGNNGHHYISVWFTFKGDVLYLVTWEMNAKGHYKHERPAPLQTSEHSDWILID